MKFTKIKRLISGPDFSNVGLEGEIEPGESVDHADFILRTKLSSMISEDRERRILLSEVDRLSRKRKELMEDCEKLKKLISDQKEFLESNGIKIDDVLYSDIPF